MITGQQQVWKFELTVTDASQKIEMPEGAMPCHVAVQKMNFGRNRRVQMWATVDPTRPLTERYFVLVGTGQPAPGLDHSIYIGTVLDNQFVWHVFEVFREKRLKTFGEP